MTPALTRPQAPGEGDSLVALWITDLFICFFFSIYLNGRSTSHKLRNEFHTPIWKCGPKTNTCSSFNGVHQHTCSPVPFASVSFVCNKVSWPSNHRGAVWGSCFLAAVLVSSDHVAVWLSQLVLIEAETEALPMNCLKTRHTFVLKLLAVTNVL